MRQLVPIAVLAWLVGCSGVNRPREGSDGGADRAHRAQQGRAAAQPSDGDAAPPRPPYSCFAAGTPIATPDGERAIETLGVGDPVWAFDTLGGVRVRSWVTAVHHHPPALLSRLVAPHGRVLLVTDNHPIYLPELDRFVPVGRLSGDELVLGVGDAGQVRLATVSGLDPRVDYAPVFNITVAGAHDYFAAGVLVHNKEPPPCPTYDWATGTGCGGPPPSCNTPNTCAVSRLGTDGSTGDDGGPDTDAGH